jgi:hypothetical protein
LRYILYGFVILVKLGMVIIAVVIVSDGINMLVEFKAHL